MIHAFIHISEPTACVDIAFLKAGVRVSGVAPEEAGVIWVTTVISGTGY
jgi:hypothetical protein